MTTVTPSCWAATPPPPERMSVDNRSSICFYSPNVFPVANHQCWRCEGNSKHSLKRENYPLTSSFYAASPTAVPTTCDHQPLPSCQEINCIDCKLQNYGSFYHVPNCHYHQATFHHALLFCRDKNVFSMLNVLADCIWMVSAVSI